MERILKLGAEKLVVICLLTCLLHYTFLFFAPEAKENDLNVTPLPWIVDTIQY